MGGDSTSLHFSVRFDCWRSGLLDTVLLLCLFFLAYFTLKAKNRFVLQDSLWDNIQISICGYGESSYVDIEFSRQVLGLALGVRK